MPISQFPNLPKSPQKPSAYSTSHPNPLILCWKSHWTNIPPVGWWLQPIFFNLGVAWWSQLTSFPHCPTPQVSSSPTGKKNTHPLLTPQRCCLETSSQSHEPRKKPGSLTFHYTGSLIPIWLGSKIPYTPEKEQWKTNRLKMYFLFKWFSSAILVFSRVLFLLVLW